LDFSSAKILNFSNFYPYTLKLFTHIFMPNLSFFNKLKSTLFAILILGSALVVNVSLVPSAAAAQEQIINVNASKANAASGVVGGSSTAAVNPLVSLTHETIKYSGSCSTLVSDSGTKWVVNSKDNTTYSTSYFVRNENKLFRDSDTPSNSASKYVTVSCNR
jgi:hypothetical protein